MFYLVPGYTPGLGVSPCSLGSCLLNYRFQILYYPILVLILFVHRCLFSNLVPYFEFYDCQFLDPVSVLALSWVLYTVLGLGPDLSSGTQVDVKTCGTLGFGK